MSAPADGARAHAADEAVNRTSPVTYTRRRPSRSPRAEAVSMPAPNAMVYALTVHCRVPTPPPS